METLKDCLIIVEPPQPIEYGINYFKNFVSRVVEDNRHLYSRPHITINYIGRKPLHEIDRITEYILQRICNTPSTVFNINGFSVFDQSGNTKTIYAKIEQTESFKGWLTQLKRIVKLKSELHLTIARSISDEEYTTLWSYFQNMHFKKTFKPKRILFLIRDSEDKKSFYEVLKTAEFKC
jgi:2'-5' RNA ligase